MTSAKKFNWKRALTIFLIVIVAFCATSMVATKIIYDAIFVRYDGQDIAVPAELEEMVDAREDRDFLSGENMLNGYLYRCEGANANGNHQRDEKDQKRFQSGFQIPSESTEEFKNQVGIPHFINRELDFIQCDSRCRCGEYRQGAQEKQNAQNQLVKNY
jgi:hypothetical protein